MPPWALIRYRYQLQLKHVRNQWVGDVNRNGLKMMDVFNAGWEKTKSAGLGKLLVLVYRPHHVGQKRSTVFFIPTQVHIICIERCTKTKQTCKKSPPEIGHFVHKHLVKMRSEVISGSCDAQKVTKQSMSMLTRIRLQPKYHATCTLCDWYPALFS